MKIHCKDSVCAVSIEDRYSYLGLLGLKFADLGTLRLVNVFAYFDGTGGFKAVPCPDWR